VDSFGFGLKESLEFSFRVVIVLKQMRFAIKKIAIKTIKMGQNLPTEEFSKRINIVFKTN
jgi:hypothetical protein